jgi:undecaprenyl-diphosphatase
MASSVALVLLARAVLAQPLFSWDLRWTLAFQSIGFRVIAPLMRALTAIGDNACYIPLVSAAIVVVALSGREADAVAVLVSVIGGELLPYRIKTLVQRPRPSPDQIHTMRAIALPSFPSGHVVRFVVFFGFVLALAYPAMPAGVVRASSVAVFGLLAVGIGLSRVYLGEHWPSDVLGGYLTGICWLCATLLVHSAALGAG